MIAATSPASQFDPGQFEPLHWQQALADAIADPAELCAVLDLDPALLGPAAAELLATAGFTAGAARRSTIRSPRSNS